MLRKTAMALFRRFASWRCRARVDHQLGTVGREPRFHRRQLSVLPGKRLGQQVSGRPTRPLSRQGA